MFQHGFLLQQLTEKGEESLPDFPFNGFSVGHARVRGGSRPWTRDRRGTRIGLPRGSYAAGEGLRKDGCMQAVLASVAGLLLRGTGWGVWMMWRLWCWTGSWRRGRSSTESSWRGLGAAREQRRSWRQTALWWSRKKLIDPPWRVVGAAHEWETSREWAALWWSGTGPSWRGVVAILGRRWRRLNNGGVEGWTASHLRGPATGGQRANRVPI